MRPYVVQLLLGFEQRPRREEQTFLASHKARVQPWGTSDLGVALEVEAADMVTALSQAMELVADRLGGDLLTAHVAVRGFNVRPGGWWQRWPRPRRPRDR